MFDHKEPFITYVFYTSWYGNYSMSYVQGYFWATYLLIFLSDIHSLSENESCAEGMYSVFVALQENPSLQKLEWVQQFLSFSLVEISYWISFVAVYLHGWLCGFLIEDHSSNKTVAYIADPLSWL